MALDSLPGRAAVEAALAELPAPLAAIASNHLEALARNLAETDQELPAAGAPLWSDIARVLALSDFVARSLLRTPALIGWLGDGLDAPRRAGEIAAALTEACAGVADERDLGLALRRVRRREMVRLAWRDLCGRAGLEELTATVSELADAAIDAAVAAHYRWCCAEWGTPRAEDGDAVALVVLGLGKLGGRELNFSSDVDLMFAYAQDGETDGPRGLSNHEFFVRLGRRLIRTLDEVTADGFVFRVDMRLRPNGDSGPLALSFDAMEHYYQTHGRDWERYALVKARVVAGDRDAGQRLLAILRPFVYRKYLDFGAFEAIRSMKILIESEHSRRSGQVNIKLGRGGIREIEFIVQSYQLIRGGREQELQTQSFFAALEALAGSGVIGAAAAATLAGCYRFLRDSEHRLQMIDDRQTQLLPDDDRQRQRLARAMGFDEWPAYRAELDRVMGAAHRQFVEVFAPAAGRDGERHDPLARAWSGAADAGGPLAGLGYRQPEEMVRLLESLRGGRVYQTFSRAGRERLDRLMPLAIRAAAASPDPDVALRRLVSIIEAIGRRSAYLALLTENPLALEQLVRLIGASAWIATWVGQHPVILDELLDPIASFRPPEVDSLRRELRRRLDRPDTDLETVMDFMREIRHGHVLRVAAADLAGLLDTEATNRALCAIAEAVLAEALASARDNLRHNRRLDEARAAADNGAWEPGIIAYGKLGSYELGYNSDLDIVFVYDDGGAAASDSNVAYYFGRLVQRAIHILTTRTRAGLLYEIDMRLRPSGRAGTLVTPLQALASYQREQAWTWEHQALVRARVVAGGERLRARFEDIRRTILCQPRDAEALAADIVHMRDRMIAANCRSTESAWDLKLDRGGLVDIEFLVQYLVLRWAAEHPAIIAPRDNRGVIAALIAAGILDQRAGRTLMEHYLALLRRELELKLQEQPPLIGRTELEPVRSEVERLWERFLGAAVRRSAADQAGETDAGEDDARQQPEQR